MVSSPQFLQRDGRFAPPARITSHHLCWEQQWGAIGEHFEGSNWKPSALFAVDTVFETHGAHGETRPQLLFAAVQLQSREHSFF